MNGPKHLGGDGTAPPPDPAEVRRRKVIQWAVRPKLTIMRALLDRNSGMIARGVDGALTQDQIRSLAPMTRYELAEWLVDMEETDKAHQRSKLDDR
jgi:hypothetical protein